MHSSSILKPSKFAPDGEDIVDDGKSVAARMSEMNAREWNGDLEKVYEYATFPDTLPKIV